MPWSHCSKTINDDDPRCPVCGISKGSWTVRLARTRRLVLGNRDEEAQVTVLERAAERGAPFCEKCEAAKRAKQEAERFVLPEDPVAPADQTLSLKRAAARGAPFCEKCERHRREKAARASQGEPREFYVLPGETPPPAQAAQARTLRAAARSGTPFCARCEAAKRARAQGGA
jgi:hypothetical protein